MIDIVDKAMCCGCSACDQICPTNCITMEADTEGFEYPVVDKEKCIYCEKCVKACPFLNIHTNDANFDVYSSTHKDKEILKKSSSGGVFYALSEYILNQNGVIFGAAFNNAFDVEHIMAENINQLYPIMGSKYVQSSINNTYIKAKRELDTGRKVLFSGTQCQINGLHTFLGKEYRNLITVAVVCHGVPSPKVWCRYLEELSNDRKANIVGVNFRHKSIGWKPPFGFQVLFDDGSKYFRSSADNVFLKGFSQDLFLRPSCYKCKSKGKNLMADIEIGDFWGVEDKYPPLYDEHGVSIVFGRTIQGKEFLKSIKNSLKMKEVEYNHTIIRNPNIEISVRPSNQRKNFFQQMNTDSSITKVISYNLPKPINSGIRSAYLHNTLKLWLHLKQDNKKMENFLEEFKYKNIVIYGAGELASLFIKELKGSNINIIACVDKYIKVSSEDLSGVGIIDLYEASQIVEKIDCVVITALLSVNPIIYDLTRLGYPLDKIITLNMILYSM